MPVPIWAGRYIGLPFADHGRDRAGLDCWGLVRLVLGEQFGIPLPSFAGQYSRTTDTDRISRLIARETPYWQALEKGEEETGDVAVFRIRGRPMHVGLVLGDGQMLHIEFGINSVIEKYKSSRWADRLYGFYRYQPLNDMTDTDDDRADDIFSF